jgi:cation diffusion facilitator CzcD-associated flavoprotein CzcO
MTLIEKHPHVAHHWRNHYDRLHLHTNKSLSHLPFVPFDQSVPKYPSRDQVVEYLEQYAEKMQIKPVFNTEVVSIKRENNHWVTSTANETYVSKYVVMATGSTQVPKMPHFPGQETFPGKILHSAAYKNGRPFQGQQVLVVGFGNSAGEQAIDLHEHGAFPALSVRSAVNVVPRDIFGISALQLGVLLNGRLPPQTSDAINAPLIKWLVGDLNKMGLKKSADGPLVQIQKTGRIPLLDIGTIKLIKEGHIRVFDGIDRIDGKTVYFNNGKNAEFDAIVMATGYDHGLEKILKDVDPEVFNDLNRISGKQVANGKDGLYFCGYFTSPTGMLREMGIAARWIAEEISGK